MVEYPRSPGPPVGDIGNARDGVCKRLEIERITDHTLKHSAITLDISGGGDPMLAAEFFSSTFSKIEENYLHLHPNFQEKAFPEISRLGKRPGRNGSKLHQMGRNESKISNLISCFHMYFSANLLTPKGQVRILPGSSKPIENIDYICGTVQLYAKMSV